VKKAFILKGRNNFQGLFKKGKRFSGSALLIIVGNEMSISKEVETGRQSDECEKTGTRIGISIGKKFGNAVERNKAKRVIRAFMREMIPLMSTGNYVIIRPGPDFKQYVFSEARGKITKLLRRAGLLSQ
jgi:ribonuclease P protein component